MSQSLAGKSVIAEVAQSVKIFKCESEESGPTSPLPGYSHVGKDPRKEGSRTQFSDCHTGDGWAGASGDEETLEI